MKQYTFLSMCNLMSRMSDKVNEPHQTAAHNEPEEVESQKKCVLNLPFFRVSVRESKCFGKLSSSLSSSSSVSLKQFSLACEACSCIVTEFQGIFRFYAYTIGCFDNSKHRHNTRNRSVGDTQRVREREKEIENNRTCYLLTQVDRLWLMWKDVLNRLKQQQHSRIPKMPSKLIVCVGSFLTSLCMENIHFSRLHFRLGMPT